MPTFESFRIDLDTHGWEPYQQDSTAQTWANHNGDFLTQRLVLLPPSDLPAGYPDLDALRAHFESILVGPMGVVIVSLDILSVKGIEAFRPILKFRVPERELAKRYLG